MYSMEKVQKPINAESPFDPIEFHRKVLEKHDWKIRIKKNITKKGFMWQKWICSHQGDIWGAKVKCKKTHVFTISLNGEDRGWECPLCKKNAKSLDFLITEYNRYGLIYPYSIQFPKNHMYPDISQINTDPRYRKYVRYKNNEVHNVKCKKGHMFFTTYERIISEGKKGHHPFPFCETGEIIKIDVYLFEQAIKKEEKRQKFLLPHQVLHVKNLMQAYLDNEGRILDGSDTGLGKTYHAGYIAKSIRRIPFVVCKLNFCNTWYYVLKYHFGIEEFYITNHELLQRGKMLEFVEKEGILTNKKTNCPWFDPYAVGKCQNVPLKFIFIWDEIHVCKNANTMNSKFIKSLCEIPNPAIGLSATVMEKPESLEGFGPVFHIFSNRENEGESYRSWLNRMRIKQDDYLQPQAPLWDIEKIRAEVFQRRGARLIKSQVLDMGHRSIISAEPFNVSDAPKIQKELLSAQRLAQKCCNDGSNYSYNLGKWKKQMIKVELAKIPVCLKVIKKYIRKGNHVATFLNHVMPLEKLYGLLNQESITCEKAVCYYGKMPQKQKVENLRLFNENKKQIILFTIQSGGHSVDLHDTDGRFPRVSLISPTYSALDLTQTLGRLDRSGAKSISFQKIVYCSGTLEERAARTVQKKIIMMDKLNDEDILGGFGMQNGGDCIVK